MIATNLLRTIRTTSQYLFPPKCSSCPLRKYVSSVCLSPWGHVVTDSACSSPFCVYEARRYYNRKKTIKIPPTKPLTFPLAGDADQPPPPLVLTDPKPGFNIPELELCDETVKKIFSLRYANGQAQKEKRIENILNQVKEHPADVASLEVKIAKMTVEIRGQMKHCLSVRKDKVSKVMLLERIQKRRSWIEKLRRLDIEKFDWLLKELKIKYVPQVEYNRKLHKRALRQKAARDKFLAIKKARMAEFRQKVEEEREEFNKFKEREFQDIEKQLKEIGIDKFESLEQALDDLNLGQTFLVKKIPVSSRRRCLQKKFEMYKHRRIESLQ